MRVAIVVLTVGMAFTFATGAYGASQTLQQMAEKLLDLRAEVETAGAESEERRKQLQSEVDVLLQRKSELEMMTLKEKLRTTQLHEKESALRKQLNQVNHQSGKEQRMLKAWARDLEDSIRESIPFRVEERLGRVQEISRRIDDGRESGISLAAELWNLTDRELKMASENEYRVGRVKLQNSEDFVDAEIARIGRIQMLFVTSKNQAGWGLVPAENPDEEKAIRRLVARFKEHRESGWFEVPGLQLLKEVQTP